MNCQGGDKMVVWFSVLEGAMRRYSLFISILVVVLSGCSQATVEPTQVQTEIPPTETNTPIPPSETHTATNTFTPTKTFTSTPTLTDTPVPPTNTATFTSIPQPIVGEWKGEIEELGEKASILYTIEIEDGNIYISEIILFLIFSCEDNSNLIFTHRLPIWGTQEIINGTFEYSGERIEISGSVVSPDNMKGYFLYQYSDTCEVEGNWSAALEGE
jgi:hypothetical protein